MPRKKYPKLQSVKGMKDVLPREQPFWDFVIGKSVAILKDYGYEKIVTPILEQTEVFTRTIGEGTDVRDKEMYSFRTRGSDAVSLRPEGTAGIVRAYVEHGMSALPKPVKLYYVGPMFRHDRPQAGRLRQFNQIGVEVIGEDSPALDAETIFVLYKIFGDLRLKDIVVQVNSIGDKQCRSGYISALRDYYRPRLKRACANCRDKYKKNVLRLLECVDEQCQPIAEKAPQMMDYLDEACKKHFTSVLEFLDELEIPYILNPRLVRGLDYYTRTVFEFVPQVKDDEGTRPLTLAAGGRYDGMVELFGERPTPAIGWSMGIERIIELIKQREVKIPVPKKEPKVFLVQLGDSAKRKIIVLFEELRKANITAVASVGRDSIKSQLRIANKLGVKFTLIIGQREALDNSVILRDMKSSIQEVLRLSDVAQEIKRRLKKRP